MGCDIHCFVEKRVNGKWGQITGFRSNKYSEDSEYFGTEKYKSQAISPIDNRSYNTFAVLAGVRNDDKGIIPISEPKGWPKDVSEAVKALDWEDGGHSYSWLSVKELIGYDWDQTVSYSGIVGPQEYAQYREKGSPSSWCMGSSRKLISNSEMDAYLETPSCEDNFCTQVSWNQLLRDDLQTLIYDSIPQLVERCDGDDYESVRIVFFFDN